MNKDKIKWLYRKTAKRYHHCHRYPWESITEYISKLDEEVEWNFPYIRKKSNFKKIQQLNCICKEFGVKGYSNEYILKLNPYNDDKAMAWNEKKSWKRNSKRKHQWKEKIFNK